ncbi:hypothetical protein ACFXTI_039949 [Malus domestica]
MFCPILFKPERRPSSVNGRGTISNIDKYGDVIRLNGIQVGDRSEGEPSTPVMAGKTRVNALFDTPISRSYPGEIFTIKTQVFEVAVTHDFSELQNLTNTLDTYPISFSSRHKISLRSPPQSQWSFDEDARFRRRFHD